MTKKTDTKEVLKPAEFARKVWLAGVGAYGKAFEDAQERFGKFNLENSNELFESLVEKGEKIESTTQERIEKARDEATTNIEERIAKVRENIAFPFAKAGSDERLEKLELEVASLKRKVSSLTKSTKAAPKKTARKKAA